MLPSGTSVGFDQLMMYIVMFINFSMSIKYQKI